MRIPGTRIKVRVVPGALEFSWRRLSLPGWSTTPCWRRALGFARYRRLVLISGLERWEYWDGPVPSTSSWMRRSIEGMSRLRRLG